jgi:hypothetical protein
VEILLLNCWKNTRKPFVGGFAVAVDVDVVVPDGVILETTGGVGMAVVLKLDFITGRAFEVTLSDPVVLELKDPSGMVGAVLTDC